MRIELDPANGHVDLIGFKMAEGQGGLEHSILPAAGKWGAIGFGQLYPALGTLSTYSLAQLPTQRRTYLLKR